MISGDLNYLNNSFISELVIERTNIIYKDKIKQAKQSIVGRLATNQCLIDQLYHGFE